MDYHCDCTDFHYTGIQYLEKQIAKRKNEVENLSAKADKLNEEIVYRLSTEMNDIQVISKQIGGTCICTGS